MVGAGPSGPVRRRDGLGEARDASDVVVKKRALDAGHGVAGTALVGARPPSIEQVEIASYLYTRAPKQMFEKHHAAAWESTDELARRWHGRRHDDLARSVFSALPRTTVDGEVLSVALGQ